MTRFFYRVSLFDKEKNEWRNDDRFPIINYMNTNNRHTACAMLLVFMRNDMEENRYYYHKLHKDNIACKWSIFSTQVNEDGKEDISTNRLIYSVATERFVSAKTYLLLNHVFDV